MELPAVLPDPADAMVTGYAYILVDPENVAFWTSSRSCAEMEMTAAKDFVDKLYWTFLFHSDDQFLLSAARFARMSIQRPWGRTPLTQEERQELDQYAHMPFSTFLSVMWMCHNRGRSVIHPRGR